MSKTESKQTIIDALEQNDLDGVALLVKRNRRLLSLLIRIAYDKETLAGWRAILAIGLAAKMLVDTDYEYLRVTVRKLLWSLSDESGGIGWAAPEILGEIVRSDPERFYDIIPLIAEVYDVEEKIFRPGVMYALSVISEVAPKQIVGYNYLILKGITDSNPLVRVNSADIVGKLWKYSCENGFWSIDYRNIILQLLDNQKNDNGVVWIYENNSFINISVGENIKKTLNNVE